MKPYHKLIESFKGQIEMNNFGMIYSLMKKRINFHFFADRVKRPANAYFDFSNATAIWSDDFRVLPYEGQDNQELLEIFIDLKLEGNLCEHNGNGKTFFQEPIKVDLGIRAYTTLDGWTTSENINLMNGEQKALTIFHNKYIDELQRVGSKTIAETEYLGEEAYTFFTRTWKNVDVEKQHMVDGASLDYFHEFVEAHRNVIFQVACANMWGRYRTHYTDNSYTMESAKIYPHAPSFYDTRFTIYLETAMEDLYSFYERCAHFVYLFLDPPNILPHALSFSRLFDKRTVRALRAIRPNLAANANWQWFSSRLRNEHKTLSEYRHPLVHYQQDASFIRGSYGAALTRLSMQSAYDDPAGLEELLAKMDAILAFLNTELPKCHQAFINVVQLCEALEPVPAKKRNYIEHMVEAVQKFLRLFKRKVKF